VPQKYFKSVDFHELYTKSHTIFMDFYGLKSSGTGHLAHRLNVLTQRRGARLKPASVEEFDEFRAEIYP
jgi:hypothetical protein